MVKIKSDHSMSRAVFSFKTQHASLLGLTQKRGDSFNTRFRTDTIIVFKEFKHANERETSENKRRTEKKAAYDQ